MVVRQLRLVFRRLTCDDWLLACFALGVLTGTGAALAFGGPVVQGSILGAAQTAGQSRCTGVGIFLSVWRQRALETGAGWLAGLTVCSQLLYGVLTFYCGMSVAVVLSVLTMRKGMLGIGAFLGAVLPQGILYLMVWYVLSRWAGPGPKRLHILPGILLLLIAGAGACLEIYLIPVVWGMV